MPSFDKLTKLKIIKLRKIFVKINSLNAMKKLYKLKQLLSCLLGCVLTFYIWNYTKINNLLVSETLTLLFSLMFPNQHDDIFFSASLAGLTNKIYLPNAGFVFLLSFLDFFIFNASKNILNGFGGKFGTIGFISNLIACFFAYLNQQNQDYPFENLKYYEILDVYFYVFGPLICGVSCYLSYIYHNYFNLSKFVGLNVNGVINSFLLLLINIYPLDYLGNSFVLNYGEVLNYFSQIGLLAALMKQDIFKEFSFKTFISHHYFFVGYLAGWLNISIFPYFNVGGKNGFVAFVTSNFYIRSLWFVRSIGLIGINKNKQKENKIDQIFPKEDEADFKIGENEKTNSKENVGTKTITIN